MAAAPNLNGVPWSIVQVTTSNPKRIALTGASAPHGRSRHEAMVDNGMELRRTVTRYPGNNRPTRHTFGVKYEDFILKGRWSDSFLGAGGAAALVLQFKALIADEIPCQIFAGDFIAATGLPVKLGSKWESSADVVWELIIEIDSDDMQPTQLRPALPGNPFGALGDLFDLPNNGGPSLSLLQKFAQAVQRIQAFAQDGTALAFGFLEKIDDVVSVFTGLTGQLASIAGSIDTFERASASELTRVRGIVGQMKTAGLTLASAFDDASNDFSVQSASSNSQLAYAQARQDAILGSLFILAILSALDDQAAQVLAGKVNTSFRAKDGDTWESISISQYGSIDNADALRQANGARGGQLPKGGRIIHLPKA